MRITVFGDAMYKREYDALLPTKSPAAIFASFADLADVFSASDFNIVNLETPVAGEESGYVAEQFSFNAPLAFAQSVKKLGADMVLCANNHCLDRGVQGLLNTVKNLKEIGLDYIGIRDKKEPAHKIVEVKGIRVGFVNFTYGTNAFSNGQYLNRSAGYMVDLLQKQELHNKLVRKIYYARKRPWSLARGVAKRLHIGQMDVLPYARRESDFFEKRRFVKAIRDCKKSGADYVVVLPHIGDQYGSAPSAYTKEICDLAIRSGADAVVANHEHLIHPAKAENGKCIAYSLGNFFGVAGVLCAPYDKKSEYSMAVHLDFEKGKAPAYAFSLYKTICEDNVLKTVSLYDLIQSTTDENEKQRLVDDNAYFVNYISGMDGAVELKREYGIGR